MIRFKIKFLTCLWMWYMLARQSQKILLFTYANRGMKTDSGENPNQTDMYLGLFSL